MMIPYCFSLASKSSIAFDDIQYNQKKGIGLLILPSPQRLRDYKNWIRPERWFNNYTIFELLKKAKKFSKVNIIYFF